MARDRFARSRRVLITGGAGFIGSHLADALVSAGDRVVVLDDFSTGRPETLAHLRDFPALEIVEGSTLDPNLVDDLVRSTDATLHLASAVGVQLIVSSPLSCLLGNVRGTDNVFASAVGHGKRLLFTSTSEVYGKNSAGPLSEDADRILGSAFKSRWAYAMAKGFGEALAHGYYRDCRAEVIVARLFNTVGARQTAAYGMVLPRFVRQALDGEDLTVYGDGTQTRCFTHVADTVQALLLLLDNDAAVGQLYNVGSQTEIPVIELARRVIEATGSDSKIQLIRYEEAYGEGFEELGKRKPETRAIRELTGWEPTRTIDDAINDVIAYERSRRSTTRSAAVAP
jgi:nucleoside-diphosphate-sugar epimerase